MTPSKPDFAASQYLLRAAFYYRKHELWRVLKDMNAALVHRPERWHQPADIGVTAAALDRVVGLHVPLERIFAHPSVLVVEPRLVAYYRSLALLPQKGLGRLAFNTAQLEAGEASVSLERATILSRTLNSLLSVQIESDPMWTVDKSETAAVMNIGSQINGSWRNSIGEEGGRQIKVLLMALLSESGAVASTALMDGTTLVPPVEPSTAVSIREIHTINGYSIRFAPEPDVAVRDPQNLLVGTIEVKYGSDPAGALERYGAAKKSFEEALRENVRVQNVYLANAITAEVRKRIDEDRLVREAFDFNAILTDTDERHRFQRFITRQLLDL